jgi:hypothetical protein
VTIPRHSFTEAEVRRVISLLSSTDMTIKEIADRMGCSRSTICAINLKAQVRNYAGRRTSWEEMKTGCA